MKNFIILTLSVFIFFSCSLFSKKLEDVQSNKQEKKSDSTINENKIPDEKKTANSTEELTKPANKDNNFKLLTYDKNSIPKDCEYKGKILDGARWIDKNGENILIVSNTPLKDINKEAGEREQRIFACNYISDGSGGYRQLWKIEDFSDSYCDAGADIIPGTIEVLDIDGDGIAENLFIYKLEGRCDVSPLNVKLMMHTGSTKLVIRGNTIVHPGQGQTFGGEKNFDPAFNSVPKELKSYASKKWDEFIKSYKDQ